MSYLQDKDSVFTVRRNTKKNTSRNFFVFFVLVFSVYIVFFTSVFGVLERRVNKVAVPFWKTSKATVSVWDNIRVTFISKKSLLAENKKLEAEIGIAKLNLIDRNLLLIENIELKELFGRKTEEQMIFSVVLAKPNRTLYDTLIIDVGENSGVQEGDSVLYAGNILIGKISEVFENSSKVSLFSSPSEETNIIIGTNNITTIAVGKGNGNFELKLPRDANVENGDVAFVADINPRIIGTIEHIEYSPSDPFKLIMLRGPVNIFELKWVDVAIK